MCHGTQFPSASPSPSPRTPRLCASRVRQRSHKYAPRFVTLLKRRSSAGVSVLTLAAGLLAGTLNLINAAILNWDKIICCGQHAGELAAAQCLANNLVVEQLSVGPACMLVVFVLVLVFFEVRSRADERAYRLALAAFLGTLFVSVAATMVALVLYYSGVVSGPWVVAYGKWIGIASALLTLLQWAPQIALTWRTQDAGALSLGTLLLQFPGNLLVVVFQLSAPRSHWTSWAPYIVSAAQMLVLIVLLLYFQYRETCLAPKRLEDDVGDDEVVRSLSSPSSQCLAILSVLGAGHAAGGGA